MMGALCWAPGLQIVLRYTSGDGGEETTSGFECVEGHTQGGRAGTLSALRGKRWWPSASIKR